jgi:hypothetical protein
VLGAEARLGAAALAAGDVAIATDPNPLQERTLALDEGRREFERLYERWAELEEKRQGARPN